MTVILLIAVVVLLLAALGLLIVVLARVSRAAAPALSARLDAFDKAQDRTEHMVREEIIRNREELGAAAREQRLELTAAFTHFGDSVMQRMHEAARQQKMQLDAFSSQLNTFATASGERLDAVRREIAIGARQLREEVVATLRGLADTTTATMREMSALQKAQLETMSAGINRLADSTARKIEEVRQTIEGKLQSMQADNALQLDRMRQTVDEKLQGTLEKRLGESFKQVSERLELVHKGLGEMQTLATGVGDLKKVLTNVKTRGTWGEVQLGALLEQGLNPDQFASNVSTKDGGERVEYAIRLPGQAGDRSETVWLPIDAKFPVEDYQRLVEAQERADADGAEAAGRQLENRVKACAADISRKYLNPPTTTDFAILFLPIEGLFAEVIRRPGLPETVQRDCRVIIAGPTTLWSIISSLQMGFRTLAIQQRSSEVWNLLAAVKTEWTKYGDILDAVQKKLTQASETIDKARVRSRAVGRKLKDVQELPAAEAGALLPAGMPDDSDDADVIANADD
jgi:DNA recombination protein RmuC